MLPLSQETSDANDDMYTRMAMQLLQKGWCVQPEFLPYETVRIMREHALLTWLAGDFRHAGVGRKESFQVKPEVRNDYVMWLDKNERLVQFNEYFNAIESLRLAINRALYIGLFDFEAHLAIYPAGSFYKKHLDQFKGIGLRAVTTTFYLNEDWQTHEGGQLRLYDDRNDETRYTDIQPLGGTLVAFLSAEFLHEVLSSTRERLSVTGWYRRRE